MLSAPQVLDQYYLDTRCLLLEVAAVLDRLDAAVEREGSSGIEADPRFERIRTALDMLADREATPDRSERFLRLFSDPSD